MPTLRRAFHGRHRHKPIKQNRFQGGPMLLIRIIAGIICTQFILFMLLILCHEIAGPKNAMNWYAFISLTLGALFIFRKLRDGPR
jgi:hypothetical protein